MPYFCCMNNIERIHTYIAEERNALLQHPLYHKIHHIEDLQKFTEGHVYAVWDFMSLLKALQIQLTCVTLPWQASPYPNTRYLINEIVLAEESDEYMDGRRLSHFEMYLDAMQHMEANCRPIQEFTAACNAGDDIFAVIDNSGLDSRIQDFLRFTFEVIATGEAHKIAAAFTFGREDLIPSMFTAILQEIQQQFPEADLLRFHYYFQRHIELDGDEHGPLAMQMILELAAEDQQKWDDMQAIALTALQKRHALWDAISDSL